MQAAEFEYKKFNLNDLVDNYDYVLFGSDAIIAPFAYDESEISFENKKMFYQELEKKVRNRRIYLSRKGAEKITSLNMDKPKNRFYSLNPNLVSTFGESDRLLGIQDFCSDIHKKEAYNQTSLLYENYSRDFSFNKEEEDLIFLGVALSKNKSSRNNYVSIVANNPNLSHCYQSLRHYLDKDLNVDFYKRVHDNSFVNRPNNVLTI
ncbi:MAG: hypothetical protein ABEI74_01285 [Candidatus Pacearchaeota archaeon]